MDRRDLERLGHHVVSRRVALGYRNRTDLATSLQFTIRTLADIEHGVRKASPGTYAILENKLGWAPGSIDTILAGGEPTETVPTLHRSVPSAPPRDTRCDRRTPTLCRSRPPRNCCWSCDGASSPPATDAAKLGTTGTTASTPTATGPRRANSTKTHGSAPSGPVGNADGGLESQARRSLGTGAVIRQPRRRRYHPGDSRSVSRRPGNALLGFWRSWSVGQRTAGGKVEFQNPSPSALTRVSVQLRLVAGASRATPRRIHGVCRAITASARSERRIAVRGPGVGVDASSASGDPARAPSRATANSCQVPGTPRNSTLPRSSKPVPEPTTRSRTVRDTRISSAPAWPQYPRGDVDRDPPDVCVEQFALAGMDASADLDAPLS